MIFGNAKRRFVAFCAACALACAAVAGWSVFVEPNRLTETRLRVPVASWAGTEKRALLAVAGDFHFSPGDDARAERIVEAIAAADPDAVLLLGDFVKGHSRASSMEPREIAAHFRKLAARVPVFAVLGNHDAYVGSREIAEALREAGVRVFDGKGACVVTLRNGARVAFGGTLDPHGYFSAFDADWVPRRPDDAGAATPFVLLSHSPDVAPFLNETVDLVVCGHTHGGQICLPGGVPVSTSCRGVGRAFSAGLYRVPETGAALFVTRGLGTSIVPARLFCPPEIAFLELAP
ncbi:MAG: metallophosphoesterase [Candidatus Spyradosoma sp.]